MKDPKTYRKILDEIENILDEIEDTLGQLRMKSLVVADKFRDEYERLVDQISAKQVYLREKFGELRDSSTAFRHQAKSEFSEGVNEIRGLFRTIGRKFK